MNFISKCKRAFYIFYRKYRRAFLMYFYQQMQKRVFYVFYQILSDRQTKVTASRYITNNSLCLFVYLYVRS